MVRRAHRRLRGSRRPGAVLWGLGNAVEILEFVKVRPTMESLFIQAVHRATAAEPVT